MGRTSVSLGSPRAVSSRLSRMADDYNAISSHAVAEGPFRDWVLLVSCSLGLLAGLGIFGFVCYLLVH